MEVTQGSQWWNIKRAAVYLDMSVAFLRKAVRQKSIPFVRAGTKAFTISQGRFGCLARVERLQWRTNLQQRQRPLSALTLNGLNRNSRLYSPGTN